MDTTIRNLDERTYRQLRASAVMQGKNVGELLNEATLAYLPRSPGSGGRSSLRALKPEPFARGNERLSEEIDAVVYGSGRR